MTTVTSEMTTVTLPNALAVNPAIGGGRAKFTPKVLALIPQWVGNGLTKSEIAERIGTTVGSLSVVCSRYGISLRRRGFIIQLPAEIHAQLSMKARDLKMSPEHLGALLLKDVVNDNLFNAVLDLE